MAQKPTTDTLAILSPQQPGNDQPGSTPSQNVEGGNGKDAGEFVTKDQFTNAINQLTQTIDGVQRSSQGLVDKTANRINNDFQTLMAQKFKNIDFVKQSLESLPKKYITSYNADVVLDKARGPLENYFGRSVDAYDVSVFVAEATDRGAVFIGRHGKKGLGSNRVFIHHKQAKLLIEVDQATHIMTDVVPMTDTNVGLFNNPENTYNDVLQIKRETP